MLSAPWPAALLADERCAPVYASGEVCSRPGQLLFRGLRIRVAVSTGIPARMQRHEMTHELQYFGQVRGARAWYDAFKGPEHACVHAAVVVVGEGGGGLHGGHGRTKPHPASNMCMLKGNQWSTYVRSLAVQSALNHFLMAGWH